MTDLTPSFAPESGQVVVQGAPAGPAGAVALIPVPGLELAFDRVDGRLTGVVVDLARTDESVAVDEITLDERVAAMLTRLFGPEAPGLILSVAAAQRESDWPVRILSPEPDLTAALSRLARLDYVRATSPLPLDSPWWAAEVAELAESAGLSALARAEARRALAPLLQWLRGPVPRQLPEQAVTAALTVAAIGAATEPETAKRLLAAIETRSGSPPSRPSATTLDVAAEAQTIMHQQVPHARLQWMIDPLLLGPGGPFRPGLSPCSDLVVGQAGEGAGQWRLTVEAQLARPANANASSRYKVRAVDPGVRRILAQSPFGDAPDPSAGRIQAELAITYPLDELEELWVEVVPDELHPVRSTRSYRTARALRWADAALRAERAPRGLAPRSTADDWAALAAAAWDRSRCDWTAAGDHRRARLARPASQPLPDGPACLAEMLGG
jgi:hypothetical protein